MVPARCWKGSMRALRICLLLGLGFSCCGFFAAECAGSAAEEAAKEATEADEDVLVLQRNNFNQVLNETKYLLVEFSIALAGPSQISPAEFAKAAEELKKENVDLRLGKVDANEQKDLKKEFNIQDYPTLKFFVNGDRTNPIDCKGVRTASALVTWVKRRIGPCAVLINSTEQAKAFISPGNLAVIGFFKSLQDGAVEVFYESSRNVPELPFGVTANEEVFANFGAREETVVIFQKGMPVHNEAFEDNRPNQVELTRIIKTFTMDMVTEYNLETSVKIFDVPVESHVVLFMPKSSNDFIKAHDNYSSVAPEFRGKIMFIFVDTDETRNGRVIEYFHVTEVEVPAVQILNLTDDARYKMPAEDITSGNLRSFCQSYLEGKAKRHWSSEEIQEGWDEKPVKVLVGNNFDKVVFNKKNHVFVMFHAPWSHRCQILFPVWEELGKMFENHKNVVIAKIDYTANDIHLFNLERYPFFRYFPAGTETEVVPYKGQHTVEAFTKFLEDQIKARKKDLAKTKKRNTGKKDEAKIQKEEL